MIFNKILCANLVPFLCQTVQEFQRFLEGSEVGHVCCNNGKQAYEAICTTKLIHVPSLPTMKTLGKENQ